MFWKYLRNDFLYFVYKSIQRTPRSDTKFNLVSFECKSFVLLAKKKIMNSGILDEFLVLFLAFILSIIY